MLGSQIANEEPMKRRTLIASALAGAAALPAVAGAQSQIIVINVDAWN
jgi:uncharacterized membrane protein